MKEVKLRIKSPSAANPDLYFDVQVDNCTVLRVKELICDEYPSHPEPRDQKLVYSGRLLQDQDRLSSVLRFDDDCAHYTIHLVCRIKENQPSSCQQASATASSQQESVASQQNDVATSSSSNSANNASSDGLRQRHPLAANNTDHQTASSSTTSTVAATTTADDASQLAAIQDMLHNLVSQTPNLSVEEMAVYQQLYMQYISLNTQFLQQMQTTALSSNDTSPSPPTPESTTTVLQRRVTNTVAPPPPAVINNNNVVDNDNNNGDGMLQVGDNDANNAGGGVDPLEYAYSVLRIAILFCIMYTHSSFFRLLFVLVGLGVIYFLRNRNGNQETQPTPAAGQRNNNQEELNDHHTTVAARDNLDRESDGGEGSDAETALQDETAPGAVEEEPKPNILSVAFTFVSTLVSSILPENANLVQ
eukprot:TRINITY_DN7068_c0_g1_i1.p1 TRINITY_DN7068_c0_g1~~TRINITY_DN7068_c0_g1_i1.p1  ORF type:complete len:418 (-),score=147.68 TRINITY_DN7068_c0_g1_i1:393-1646(-)